MVEQVFHIMGGKQDTQLSLWLLLPQSQHLSSGYLCGF
jgi:hypothetical protein